MMERGTSFKFRYTVGEADTMIAAVQLVGRLVIEMPVVAACNGPRTAWRAAAQEHHVTRSERGFNGRGGSGHLP